MYSVIPHFTNYSKSYKRSKADIQYIVVHYTAGNGDTARNNLTYFKNNSVIASAHFFVDEKEVCGSVPVEYTAYHAGNTEMNAKSIGVELCSRLSNGTYYFKKETEENAAKFIAGLMEEYNIPLGNVIRHYDVTGKICPAPFVDSKAWADFKKKIVSYQKEEEEMVYYETLDQIPAGELRETVKKLVDRGTIKGNGKGLHLSEDMVRMFVFLNREGIFN